MTRPMARHHRLTPPKGSSPCFFSKSTASSSTRSISALILAFVVLMSISFAVFHYPLVGANAETITPAVCVGVPGRKVLDIASNGFCVADCEDG